MHMLDNRRPIHTVPMEKRSAQAGHLGRRGIWAIPTRLKGRVRAALTTLRSIALHVALVLGLFAASRAHAQEYLFKRFGTNADVGSVHALALDKDDFLWLGTSHGLFRYDGARATSFTLPGRSEPVVRNLAAAPDGGLWIQTRSGHLFYRSTDGTVERLVGLPEPVRTALMLDDSILRATRAGDLFVASDHAGLWHYHRATGIWIRLVRSTEDNPVRDVLENRTGPFWVASRWRLGRFSWQPGDEAPRVHWTPFPVRIRHLRPHPDGIWVLADKGLYIHHRDGRFTEVLDRTHRSWFAKPSVDADGTLALTVERSHGGLPHGVGLWRIAPDGTVLQRIHPAHGRPPGAPRQLAFDREHGLWLASLSGLYYLERPEQLVTYTWEELSGFYYMSEDPAQPALWLNNWGGLYRFEEGTLQFMSGPARGITSLPSFAPDGATLWGKRGFADVYRYREDQRGTLPPGRQFLFALPDGTQYYRVQGGLLQIRGDETSRIRGASQIHAVGPAPEYRVWVAGPNGSLDTIQEDALGSRHLERLPPSVRTIIERFQNHELRNFSTDRAGRIWVAMRSHGLVSLVPQPDGAWMAHRYRRKDGLLANNVTWVQAAPSGRLWLATARGVQGLSVTQQAPHQRPTLRSDHVIDTRDGLPLEHITCVLEDRAETLWIVPSLAGHLVRYRLNQADTLDSPPVRITSVTVNGHRLRGANLPRLRSDTTRLTLDLAPRTFRRARELRYQYRLVRLDSAWVALEGPPSVRFNYLPPGRYTFQARAFREGQPPGPVLSQSFVLTPPFYRARWFYLLCVFGGCILAALGYVWRIRRFKARERELEVLVDERTRNLLLEKKKTEAQAEKLRKLDTAKSRFFANISHEFRTPLTLITGPLDDLLDGHYGTFTPALKKQFRLMRKNARRLLRLISELLDLSKLESGRMEVNLKPGDLIAFLRRQLRRFVPMAERQRLTLQFKPAVQALPLRFDPEKLEQVVSNLVSNAVKFTPEGGKVFVTAHVRRDARSDEETDEQNNALVQSTAHTTPQGWVEIVVKDTGPGISEDDLEHLFDRFHQVDSSTTRIHEGTGIGLALARDLVELHGGRLLVESEVGFGSAFIVRLPLRVPNDARQLTHDEDAEEAIGKLSSAENRDGRTEAREPVPAPSPDVENATSDPQRPTVLVVDDNADVRAYLRSHLNAEYGVLEAANGKAGLAAVRRHKPDLVLSDVMMPEMDGYDLCRKLKADDRLSHIPIVLITARADEESTLEGLGLGADDYLAKPFNAEELLLRVEHLIAVRKQLRARFSDEVVVRPSEVVVSSEEAAFLERVREVVEAHLGDPNFTVSWLAEEVGLSRRQLHRRLKEATSLSPTGYLRMMRLERAAQLLEQQAGPVSQIAYAVGFNDAEYFSKRFRQAFGVVPSEYMADASGGPR